MSKLDELLQGVDVEWLPLEDYAIYEQPTKYLVKSKDYSNEYDIPVLTAGKTFILGYTNEKEGIYKASLTPVIIFDDFTTANKWVDFDFKAKSSAMKIIKSKDESKALLRYIYYWINSLTSDLVDGDHKRQWISNFSKKLIPIPPIEIQQEIVRVLDELTSLTNQLKTELETERQNRKKQFEFFREQLLSFEKGNVEWKELKDIFYLKNGYTPSKSKEEYWTDGTIPWFRMEDIRKNGRVLNKAIQNVNISAIKGGKLFPANSLIVATSATIGEHALVTVPYLSNQRFTNLSLKEEYTLKYKVEFLNYYCFILDEWCKNNTTIGNFAGVDMTKFKKFMFPIPPLEEQERIVKLLDQFDATHTAIEEEITKEIKLRTQQYEYYREKLLSFPSLRTT